MDAISNICGLLSFYNYIITVWGDALMHPEPPFHGVSKISAPPLKLCLMEVRVLENNNRGLEHTVLSEQALAHILVDRTIHT